MLNNINKINIELKAINIELKATQIVKDQHKASHMSVM